MKLYLPYDINETAVERIEEYVNHMIASVPELNGEIYNPVFDGSLNKAECAELPSASVDYINSLIGFWGSITDTDTDELAKLLDEEE